VQRVFVGWNGCPSRYAVRLPALWFPAFFDQRILREGLDADNQ
jgi:hypothetical protein